MSLPPQRHPWTRVVNFGSGWEAELAVARLHAMNIPARAMGNDVVGIFGPGFQGLNSRGFWVEVPSPLARQAHAILSRPAPLPDEEGEEPDEDTDAEPHEPPDESSRG